MLTGERTVPGIDRENYWFRRHEVVYEWIVARGLPPGHVLEAGCGEGYGAAILARNRPVLAFDYDEAVLRHLRRAHPGIAAIRANLDRLPVADASVGSVVSLQVIEHLWDLGGFLRECRRAISPGGTLILSTPNRLTFSPGLGRGETPTNPFHLEEFDAEQLTGLVTRAGFVGPEVLGVRHGIRLPAVDDLVARQVDAILADDWSPDLLQLVASVRTSDFEIGPALPTDADLIVTADVPRTR